MGIWTTLINILKPVRVYEHVDGDTYTGSHQLLPVGNQEHFCITVHIGRHGEYDQRTWLCLLMGALHQLSSNQPQPPTICIRCIRLCKHVRRLWKHSSTMPTFGTGQIFHALFDRTPEAACQAKPAPMGTMYYCRVAIACCFRRSRRWLGRMGQ